MFDALEARLNRAALVKLANATAVIPGAAVPVPVIFDAEYKAGMVGVVGMGAAAPQMVISSAEVPADFIGMGITVFGSAAALADYIDMGITANGAAWVVADCQPDSDLPTGLSLVLLEKA